MLTPSLCSSAFSIIIYYCGKKLILYFGEGVHS